MSLNLISLAHAEDGAAVAGGSPYTSVLIIVVLIAVFYFVIFRPQAKRNKEQKQMLASLNVGSEVLTNGGLIGTITKMKADHDLVTIQIAAGVEIVMKRGFIVNVLPQGTIKSINE